LTGQNSFWFANPSTGFYNDVIDQSLRFNKGDNAELTRTPSSASNRKTFTLSTWVKRSGTTDAAGAILLCAFASSYSDFISFDTSDRLTVNVGNAHTIGTNAVFRDTTNWFHVVVAFDVTESTATDRIKIYINGTQQTLQVIYSSFPANQNYAFNNTVIHTVGGAANFQSYQFDGYLAEYNFIDGSALTPSSFGETKNGVWIPKELENLTYGTNGFRLTFADSSSLGDDTSGNGNDYSSTDGLASTDVVPDNPENNFATLNRLQQRSNSSATITEGNLKAVGASASVSGIMTGTFGVSSGKWYWEVLAGGSPYLNTGVVSTPFDPTSSGDSGILSNEYVYLRNGNKYNNNSSASYGASYADGDIIGVALDLDNDTLTFYKNNSSQGTAYSSLPSGTYLPIFDCYNGSSWILNAGQDSSFAGAKTAQGNADGNGVGDFYYSPPSGHSALCSSNLPDTTLSPNQAEQATNYFNTVLYTGNGTGQTISGVGFQPDWTWNKNRDATDFHIVQDSSRGAGKEIFPNDDADEETYSTSITSWNTDGFVLGSREPINANGEDYVSWNWKANGGTTTSDSTGSLTVSRQTSSEAQFSIITGTTSNVQANDHTETFGHGLSGTPDFILLKPRSLDNSLWSVWTSAVAINDVQGLVWNNNNGLFTNSSYRTIQVTSTLVKIGRQAVENNSTTFVCYAFKEVEGYSKFGSYESNNNADGTFVYTNFRPAFLMTKDIDRNAMSWIIYDNKRDTFNEMNNNLNIGTSAEPYHASGSSIDFLSNGFKFRDGSSSWNNYSTETYIYMAFAAQPFKFSNAR